MPGMGNHVLEDENCVVTMDGFEPPVPRAIQLEGAGFYIRGRVMIAARDRESIHAVVRGSRPYDVAIGVGECGRVTVSCDCIPFREGSSVCRHVWAALIKVQNEDLLQHP